MRPLELHERLIRAHGEAHWWPGEHRFEIAVGAILTQNTNWAMVERALAALRSDALLDPQRLLTTAPELVQLRIRPAGYFRQKTERLRRLAEWWLQHCGSDPDALPDMTTASLRESLLALRGIGPETADSILNYAFDRPVLVVDAYTARLLTRLGMLAPPFGYDELQDTLSSGLPRDAGLYRDLHARIVEHAKQFCRKRAPNCETCPLQPDCQGPVDLADDFT